MSGHAPLDRYRARFLEQLLTEATADYWERRAEAFELAAPRPGDYLGHQTPEELARRAQRAAERATACRNHAALIRATGVGRLAWEALADALRVSRTAGKDCVCCAPEADRGEP